MFFMLRLLAVCLTLAGAEACAAAATPPADLVVLDGRVYTASPERTMAEAFAVRDGHIVYVGSSAGARAYIGRHSQVKHLGGQLVLPGLVDSHVHPLDTVERDICDLKSEALSLKAISEHVAGCLRHYRLPEGAWLPVNLWNYTGGNQPDAAHPTLRAALDRASTKHRIVLLGNDGHHAAFNSLALADAKDGSGAVVGLSRATLAKEFAAFAYLAGVDAGGEPNGMVNETLQESILPAKLAGSDYEAVLRHPERVAGRMNEAGITAMLDADTPPESLPVYDELLARHLLSLRTTLAQFYDPEQHRRPDGSVDWEAMVDAARTVRAKYEGNPLVRADEVKLFADGVAEGDPYSMPPTLPNSPAIHPYLQPIFATGDNGRATVTGYVDTDSPLCIETRAALATLGGQAIAAFRETHGFHPAQCQVASGSLYHERAVMLEFVRRFHLAGFSVHIHAIGDAASRTAIDALIAARDADGNRATRDGLAHAQLVAPEDALRLGHEHLYVAFTYAWHVADAEYDTTIVPFFVKVHGNGYADMHPPGSYYDSAIYPVRRVLEAGARITGGSDAPVDTPDPRPFINIARAVTRATPGGEVLTRDQCIGIREAIDSYTIEGARAIGWDRVAGSLELGKSADFVIVSRDILKLAESGRASDIEKVHAQETWFQGKRVYLRPRSRVATPPASS
jgi:predicted amidohydrolase YtcJ